ncbi:MAG TPA: glycosyltransferase family 4 protein [Steroidobacteraceae bacterium]
MRLLFVNYEFPPIGGGGAYASLATAREFVCMGHHVDVLTAAPDGKPPVHTIDGIRVFSVRARRRGVHESGLLGALSFLALAARQLRALAQRNSYDAYLYYFGLPTGILSLLPGAHRGRPYIISLRGSDVPGYDPALGWQHRLLRPVTRRIWRQAHRVVANSHALRRLALAALPATAIDVICNGASPPAPSPQRVRSGREVRVLAVSRLIARKGLDTLILALAKTQRPELSLDIAGEGPARDKLSALATACGVAERVRFHGFVDHASLAALYANADIFVLASLAESCSMALLEAMAAGLPVIATRVGGSVELVEHGANGLLVGAESTDELSAALASLAADASQRERFAAANRALTRKGFSWDSVARQYETLFQEALRQEPAGLALRTAGAPSPPPGIDGTAP